MGGLWMTRWCPYENRALRDSHVCGFPRVGVWCRKIWGTLGSWVNVSDVLISSPVNLQSHVSWECFSTKKKNLCSKASTAQLDPEIDGRKVGRILLRTMGWWSQVGKWHVTVAVSNFLCQNENDAITGLCSCFVLPGVAVFVLFGKCAATKFASLLWACKHFGSLCL